MQTSNGNPESRSKDSGWHLLGESSLSHFLPDPENGDQITAGLLSQTVREWSIPAKGVECLEMTLRSFAREALAHIKQGKVELPGRIRIFCQQKMLVEEMMGGWGYFVIERSRDSSSSDCTGPHHFIDLYLYQEGG